MTPDASLAFLVFSHENVEGGLWTLLRLPPLILLPLTTFRTFWFDDILALGQLGLRWLNQELLPIELDHVHIR
jgi:hypothetical protein